MGNGRFLPPYIIEQNKNFFVHCFEPLQIPCANSERNLFLIAFRERGKVRLMSLSNDFLYPQFLVLGFICGSDGNLLEVACFSVFATRSDALSFIKEYEKELSLSLRSDAFDSFSDALSPAFRLYHLTRAKF